MKQKVLLYANADFHTEVLLCLYGILKLNNYDPLIYINHNKFKVLEILDKYKLSYITTYDSNLKYIFSKIFLVAINARENMIYNLDPTIMKDFANRIVLIVHRPSYYNEALILQRYGKIRTLGWSQFAQKFNMDYLFGLDNIISQNTIPKLRLNEKIKLLLIGRFQYDDRCIDMFPEIYNKSLRFNKDFEILIIGEKADVCYKVKSDFNIKYNLDEIDFYNEIINCDFIFNLFLGEEYAGFYSERVSSTYCHILSFRKPQICHYLSNIISNTPALEFKDQESFYSIVEEAINITQEKYEKMIRNFDLVIDNYRNHNKYVLDKIFNEK